jgi:hypothetical protein
MKVISYNLALVSFLKLHCDSVDNLALFLTGKSLCIQDQIFYNIGIDRENIENTEKMCFIAFILKTTGCVFTILHFLRNLGIGPIS